MDSEWIKSSRSLVNNCVEVRRCGAHDGVWVRHSKESVPKLLHFTRAEWEAFLAGVRAGEFDFWNSPENP